MSPGQQLVKKEALAAERERQLLQHIYSRENAQLIKAAKIARNAREGKWLAFVASLARIKHMRGLYFDKIKPEREATTRYVLSNRQKDSVLTIENWWYFARLGLTWRRNHKAARCLSACFRRMWFRLWRRKYAAAAKQIRRFLIDAAGSTMVKKLYTYRTKVCKVQRWFRGWLHIQEARAEALWLAMEKVGARRRWESLRDANAAERASVRAMWNTDGFRQPMDRMNLTAKTIKKVLSGSEKMRTGKSSQFSVVANMSDDFDIRDMDGLMEKKQNVMETVSGKGVCAATKMMLKVHGALKEDPSGKHHHDNKVKYPTMSQRYKTWYWKTKVNPATRGKFEVIRKVIAEQRQRHILINSHFGHGLAARRSESGSGTGKKAQKVSIAALKFFLLNDEATGNAQYEFFESENEEENQLEVRAKAAKKQCSQFLLFSQGGVGYFETAPLTFFRK